MKNLFFTIAFLLGTFTAIAQVNLIQNVSSRKTISLDGDWNTIVDPYNHGQGHRFYLDLKFDGKTLSDYDFDTSPVMKVPGDWNTQYEKLYYYEGKIWYRRKFDAPKTDGKLFLHFGAANYEAQVWLNGKKLGTHFGGFAPFEFDITGKTRETDNSLVVCVDNTRKTDAVPTLNTDWWNYGGLTRSVCLIETANTFIQDYHIQLSKDNPKLINFSAKLNEKLADKVILLSVPALRIKKQLKTDAEGRVSLAIKASPKLWTPDTPTLYDVALTYEGETIKDKVGFRTISTQGQKILLNGKDIFLCGVNIHEEAVDGGRCTTREQDSVLLQMAKDMGCNFVRLAHYPHNEDMVRLADKMGLMVWSEIPLYWGIDWLNKKTYALAEQQLEEMISRDHNRASIIIWSIANETAVNNDRTTFLTNLANKARTLDDTRLISAALQNHNKRLAPTVYTVEDPLSKALDLFSYNEYIGWYDATQEMCDTITWQIDTDKPIVISEFGGGGKHFSANEDVKANSNTVNVNNNPHAYFNEQNQVSLYKHHFNMLRKMKGLAGTIPWILKDFRSPHRVLYGVQDDYNRKGLYTEKGEKKAAWQVVKDWNEEHKK